MGCRASQPSNTSTADSLYPHLQSEPFEDWKHVHKSHRPCFLPCLWHTDSSYQAGKLLLIVSVEEEATLHLPDHYAILAD